MQLMVWAFRLALAKAGRSMPARMAIIAMTTNNSINVKPLGRRFERNEEEKHITKRQAQIIPRIKPKDNPSVPNNEKTLFV
jgi:hypothetical protein